LIAEDLLDKIRVDEDGNGQRKAHPETALELSCTVLDVGLRTRSRVARVGDMVVLHPPVTAMHHSDRPALQV